MEFLAFGTISHRMTVVELSVSNILRDVVSSKLQRQRLCGETAGIWIWK
jgi:hypothetical protein